MAVTGSNTNFIISGVGDVGSILVSKDYLIDVYPSLVDTFKQAGLWVWGYNYYGRLGDNTTTDRNSPVQTVSAGTNWKMLGGGYYHTAAIKTDGTLWLWGGNVYGTLGDNTITHRSSPVQTISGGTNWKQVAGGGFHTAAIKTDGSLWLWGRNVYGQLGENVATTRRESPVQTISGGTNWKQVSCGILHTAAIKTDGTLWTWGYNAYGRLGDNSITDRSSPVQTVSAGTNWKQVACGYFHNAAIKTDGTLWGWGGNGNGQLGDNTITHRSSPVQTVSGGTNWKQVACGLYHTAAIKTDGTLWLWGGNTNGQIGDNTAIGRSSPVQTVSGGTNWKQVSCGFYHTAAIKTDGTLWLWGRNVFGQLGDGAGGVRSSPVQTVSAGTNWKQVACGGEQTVAIRDDSADIFGNPL